MRKHTIALFAFDGCQLLDVTGPAAVFGAANSAIEDWAYDVEIVSPAGGLVKSSCGVSLQTRALSHFPTRKVDTLLISGGGADAMRKAAKLAVTQRWVARCVRTCARFGSVCSGAFVLAELGLLKNARIATHWASCEDLAKRFPEISVDSHALFVVDGKIWTSAGVSTGIDMALAMIERDAGRRVADKIAKFLVLYARRPGYQSQFSDLLRAQASSSSEFEELTHWMQNHLGDRLDVPVLAARAGLSERTFYRKFVAATGRMPAKFVENIRLDGVRVLLSTALPLKAIATRTGMGSVVRLNSAFERRFGVTPAFFRLTQNTNGAKGRERSVSDAASTG
jgi:transcriptional regulator GlxA family with amidase domain